MAGGGDDSEAKTLPASPRKLRKAREKGQVASSTDFVTGMHVILGVLVIILTWKAMAGAFASIFSRAMEGFGGISAAAIGEQTRLAVWSLIGALAPLLLVLWIGAMLTNMLHKKGIPFSLHPITPDFNRLNPAKGFQKIFSSRNGIEFAISFARIVIWFTAIGLVLYLTLGQALFSSVCGIGCVARASLDSVGLALIVAAILLLVAGLVDLPLQFALFLKEQKMSVSELKREQKEQLGTPEMRSYRRERGREMLETAAASGEEPVLFIVDERRIAIGIYFEIGKTPIPIVVMKEKGPLANQLIVRAVEREIAIESDSDLARDLYKRVEENGRIREKHFEPVALALAKAGVFG